MLTIAWDVDDVLNSLMVSWFNRAWLFKNPSSPIVYEDLKQNPPNEILGITKEEYLDSLDSFRLNGEYSELKPEKHVHGWFCDNGHLARHIVITAVPLCAAHISSSWVLKHFGQWIRSFHFVPSRRAGHKTLGYHEKKIDLIREIGKVDAFVEDCEKNLEDYRNFGGMPILISRPWNSGYHGIDESLNELTRLVRQNERV